VEIFLLLPSFFSVILSVALNIDEDMICLRYRLERALENGEGVEVEVDKEGEKEGEKEVEVEVEEEGFIVLVSILRCMSSILSLIIPPSPRPSGPL
jgi:hypothetical protein